MTTILEESVFHLKWVFLKKKRTVSRAAVVEIKLKVKVILNVYLYFIAYFLHISRYYLQSSCRLKIISLKKK